MVPKTQVSSAAVLAFLGPCMRALTPYSDELGPECHIERAQSELDRSQALGECIGSPKYSFEFTKLYDWLKPESITRVFSTIAP